MSANHIFERGLVSKCHTLFQALRCRRFQCGFHRVNLHRHTSGGGRVVFVHVQNQRNVGRVEESAVQRRKFRLQAKLESSLPRFTFKR